MKILYLTNIPSPYRVDFFNELGKLCDLTVLYELGCSSDRDKNWVANKARTFKEVFLKGKRVGTDSALCFSILKYINDKSYDEIIVGGYSTPTGMLAIQYMNLKKISFVLNADGGMINNDSKLKYRIKKHFISSSKAWLSTGENTNNYLINYGANKMDIFKYHFTSIKDRDIVKNLISKEDKIKLRNQLNLRGNKIIITVGQFIHRKGFDILIKSMREIYPDYSVYIIGGKPTEEYLNLKKELNLKNLYFEEFKNNNQLKKYYKAADLFILPTREDVWGLVINEAMAHGLPIITTNKCVAGLELVKDGKNGFIVQVEDYSELAKRINYILSDSIITNKMALNSLKEIKDYTIENMAIEHMNILKQL